MATELQTAIEEAYASVKNEIIPLHALEINHPSFTEPIRVVRWVYALPEPKIFRLTHEDDAPIGPGGEFDYVGVPFELTLPESSQNTEGSFVIRVPVFNEIDSWLARATETSDVITAIYRQYVMDRESEGPAFCWYDIEITNPRREMSEIKADGAILGFTKKPFGGLYLPMDYPALTRGR